MNHELLLICHEPMHIIHDTICVIIITNQLHFWSASFTKGTVLAFGIPKHVTKG